MARPSIRPKRWQPPAKAQRVRLGPTPPKDLRVAKVPGTGPEDVAIDFEGRVITGLADGRIVRFYPAEDRAEVVADTGGRPLGIELLADGALLVCDAKRGLLRVSPQAGAVETRGSAREQNVELLVDRVAGEFLRFCNNAAVGADGTIYFSDSTRRFDIEHWRGELFEHSGTGRLLRRTAEGSVDVLLDGLEFANGVALPADESFVAVAETGAYRLARYWLKGPKAGTHDYLIENLHGFPDNIARGSDGLIWISQASPRNPVLDVLLPRAPFLRRLAWRLPETLAPLKRTVWVIAVNADGRIVHDIEGNHPSFHMVTGVREHQGTVYLGSLVGNEIASFRV